MDIRIPILNAFKLRITGNITSGTHTETADMNVVRNLIVNFVRRGRIFQAHGIDMQGRIVILNLGTLPSGTYGVELVGYYNGEPWRFFQKDVFEIVRQNSDATPAGSGDVPTYDVTFELNFGGDSVSAEYVDAAIAAHDSDVQAHADIREAIEALKTELRDEIAEAGEVNDVQIDGHSILDPETKVANIDSSQFGKVDDVEVNGQSVLDPLTKKVSLTIPSSASAEALDNEPGPPTATAQMVGTDIHFTFRNIKGEKGDPLTWNDLTDQQKASLKGDPGDSAVFDPESQDTPVFVMAQGLGNSTTKSMTQKAVTEAVMETVISYTSEQIAALNNDYGINDSNQWRTNSSTFRGRLIPLMDASGNPLYKGCKALIAPSTTSTVAKAAFIKEKYINGGSTDVQYADGCSRVTITEDYSADIPLDAKYLYVSKSESNSAENLPNSVAIVRPLVNKVSKAIADFSGELTTLSEQFADYDERLSDATEITTIIASEYGGGIVKAAWHIDSNNKWESTKPNRFTAAVNISQFRGKKLKITPREGLATEIALCTTGGSSPENEVGDTVVYSETAPYTGIMSITGQTTIIVVPNDITFLWVRTPRSEGYSDLYEKFPKVELVESIADGLNAMGMTAIHVDAVNGNDENDGLASSPLRTFAKAFEKSGIDVCIALHGDTSEPFVCPTGKKRVSLIGTDGKTNRIIMGNKITEAESGDGVWYVDVESFPTAENAPNYWIYLHDIDDESTAIPQIEMHPCHRGKAYRCHSTRLLRAGSLENLKGADSPMYYCDEQSGILYVNRQPTSSNPLVLPTRDEAGISANGIQVSIANVEVLYGSVVLNNTVFAEASDCAARYAYGDGCWLWDNAKAVNLTRCEAARATTGSGAGDGFNAHASYNGDELALRQTATLVDCWAHDCNDDGFSDHYRSETTIIGGLFEYCGKGGITPSFGSQVTIKGSVCRKNTGAGILYTGATESSFARTGGCLVAIGCVCEDNNGSNFRCNNSASATYPNVMMLYHCTSKRAGEYGYRAENSNCILRLTDCTDLNSTLGAKSNVTSIENTIVVS